MTIGNLKKILDQFDDNDRLIIDNGEYEANPANEIIFAYKVLDSNGKPKPVVICQTRDDFDVSNELEAQIERFQKENWDETDALMELMEYGFTVEDFRYDQGRYEWATKIAREHGLI